MVDAGGKVVNLANQRDVVRDNAIFREKVRSEKKFAKLKEEFDFNPKYLVSVTDKLNREKTLKNTGEQLMDLRLKLDTL